MISMQMYDRNYITPEDTNSMLNGLHIYGIYNALFQAVTKLRHTPMPMISELLDAMWRQNTTENGQGCLSSHWKNTLTAGP